MNIINKIGRGVGFLIGMTLQVLVCSAFLVDQVIKDIKKKTKKQ